MKGLAWWIWREWKKFRRTYNHLEREISDAVKKLVKLVTGKIIKFYRQDLSFFLDRKQRGTKSW